MIYRFETQSPTIHPDTFIAPSADIIGDVSIDANSSVWFNVTIRGDVNFIKIGSSTSIQDNSCIHVQHDTHPTIIGDEVTIGHKAMLHGCQIGNRVLIGMGAILLDGSTIGEDSIVAAGTLVPQGKEFPDGHLIMGSPAKVIRPLTEKERAWLKISAENYVNYSKRYRQPGGFSS